MIYNAENFPELPRGWASLTVDNSVNSASNSNKKLKSKDALNHGRFPVIDQGQSDISGYSDDESLVVEASESNPVILFGDHTRLLKEISQPFVPGADGTKLFRAKSFWDTRFVYQMLRAIKLPDKGYARHFQYLRESVLPLPPLNEQKRIADKLDVVLARVDACRDRLDRIPAILKRFRQSVLAAATSGKLTEDWREGQSIVNGINFKWTPMTIGSLCESSFYGPRFGKNEYTNDVNGVPTIRTTDMTRNGRIEVTESTPRVAVPDNKIDHFRVRSGDLLVTRTGSIGTMAVFDESYIAIPSAYLIRFRFKEQVLSRYAFFCLMSPYGQECLGLSTTAITQPNINAEAIRRIEILLPELEEQTEIVLRVEALFASADRLEARHTAARAKVEKLTPATLAKAFRGELVPQDPNDEPASKLLERISLK